MKIFDDCVSKCDEIEDFFLSDNYPWYLQKRSSGHAKPVKGFTDTIQFEHHFIKNDSISSPLIHSVMKSLDWGNLTSKLELPTSILRMKSNLLLKTQRGSNTPHIDMPDPHMVFLYYVNDSSGNTIFYDKDFKIIKEVSPKKGRILVFDGSIYHSSTPPITNDYRCVINIDLKL